MSAAVLASALFVAALPFVGEQGAKDISGNLSMTISFGDFEGTIEDEVEALIDRRRAFRGEGAFRLTSAHDVSGLTDALVVVALTYWAERSFEGNDEEAEPVSRREATCQVEMC